MSVKAGEKLLHFTVVDKIGEGGMGAVWRATDSTLGRDVAIKVVPQAFADDAERLARFEREARTLASLNHPNVASIYGLHESATAAGPIRFLSMELVEGEDLAERLARGPLPVDQTLAIGVQIAAALEAAHARGVIHRDLKPANVVLGPDGRVKLLDFGLAKALEGSVAAADPALSPTLTSLGTIAGVILGTAAYMSPEQARGRPVDRRTDLWAFGCVLYECLTGARLFQGETVSDSLAAVLRKDPDWTALPEDTPPLVRLLLRRCLERDPNRRLRDAGDARLELQQAIEDPGLDALGLETRSIAAPPLPRRAPWLPWAVAAFAVVALVGSFLGRSRDAPRAGVSPHLSIPLQGRMTFDDVGGAPPVVSPDGRFVAFGMLDGSGVDRLWLRPLDRFEARPLDGTENATFPFWSPDGRHLGFFQQGKLRRVEIATGRLQTIVDLGLSMPRGASWGANDRIAFVPNSNTGVWVVDAAGGTPTQVTTPDPGIPDGSHRWPSFLPDGERFLFTLWTNDVEALEQYGGVYVGWPAGDREPVRVLTDKSSAAYAPSGHLLVVQERNLLAVPFDVDALAVRGPGAVVTDGVLRNANNGFAAFSVSDEGTLVLVRGIGAIPDATLVWADRAGSRTATPVEPAPLFDHLRLSPDGTRVAVLLPGQSGDEEVWVVDLVRGVRTRLVKPAWWGYHDPIWTEDGRRVLYVSTREGSWDLYIRNADGSGEEEPFLVTGHDKAPYDIRDGRLLYWASGAGNLGSETRLYDPATDTSTAVQDGAQFVGAKFSPDGRFFAYDESEAGRREVFVRSIETGARWQVSTAGGDSPHWSDDGREIVYRDPEGQIVAVPVAIAGHDVEFGRPEVLFRLDDGVLAWDATGDHRRFLLAERPTRGNDPIYVVLDWDAGIGNGSE